MTTSKIQLLQQLVEIESPSDDKDAVDCVGSLIIEQCKLLNAQLTIHERKAVGNLIQADWFPANIVAERPILILCHMDTVFPLGTIKRMPFRIIDEKIFGPGVADMKGGIVTGLAALEAINTKLNRPVTMLFTSDEEIGSNTSREVIEELARKAALVLVLEPGLLDGSIKTWRKGVGNYTLYVHGKAAHAGGDHENGRNAIEELARQIIIIQGMTDYSIGTTLNTGKIQGGIASNVVPEYATAEIDLRIIEPSEANRIDLAIRSLKPTLMGTTIEVSGSLNRPPMPFDTTMRDTFEKAKVIADQAGYHLTAGGTGGASDANFISPLGIPVLDGLGPVGAEFHSEREFIVASSLDARSQLISNLIQNW